MAPSERQPVPGVYAHPGLQAPPKNRGDWMQTFTGRQYWPLDPDPADVDVRDIVHHLSLICRYCGACRRFYSVLEHSLGVAYVAHRQAQRLRVPKNRARDIQRRAQFHDAAEAYCHDLIRPIKRCISGYADIEALNERAISQALDLPALSGRYRAAALIKDADNAMLLAEQAVLMAPAPAKWTPLDVPAEMQADAARWLRWARRFPWRRARWWLKREFLRLHRELTA